MASTLTWKLGTKGGLHTDGLPYYIEAGIWIVCRTSHSEKWQYALWERNIMIGIYDTRQEAMSVAAEMERRRA